jgi:hypothetical protein
MPHESHPNPPLDPRSLRFPTDGVTLSEMRRVDPWVFDMEPADPSRLATTTVFGAHRIEIVLAQRAFARAAGRTPSDGWGPRDDLVSVLNCAYRSLGISRGLHQTRELVRGIETQAEVLARPHGKSR